MDVTDFAREQALHQYAYLKDEHGFPGECALSSHLFSSYLVGSGLAGDVELVYGTFGPYDLFHCWVEWRGSIIDYTMFQFLAHKQIKGFYRKATPEEILQYAISYQGDVALSKRQAGYKRLTTAKPGLISELRDGATYQQFLEDTKGSKTVEDLRWYESELVEPGVTFERFIQREGYRLTKRLFTKWAIVAA